MTTLSDSEKFFVKRFQLISGLPMKTCTEVFTAVISVIMLDNLTGEQSSIPYLGSFEFTCEGTEDTDKGTVTKIHSNFIPSPFFSRQIGLIEDKRETDVEKYLYEKIHKNLKSIIEKDK